MPRSELTDASGNTLKTKKSLLPHFSIGAFEFDNAPASFCTVQLDVKNSAFLVATF